MEGFWASFKPLLQKLHLSKYLVEIVLVGVALCIATISYILYIREQAIETNPPTVVHTAAQPAVSHSTPSITVEASGAVKKPGMYVLPYPARIHDLLVRAEGMADDADVAFVSRNVNLARLLTDQEKIYIPSLSDTTQGVVDEYKHIVDYTQPVTTLQSTVNTSNQPQENSTLININTAPLEELDQLPGVGAAIGQAIIDKRPYTSTDALIKQAVVKQSVYDKIQSLITVQ